MVAIESAATVGIPSSIGSAGSPRSGIVVHYPGTPVLTLGTHDSCRKRVRDWHQQHLNQGWAGIGYHYLICPHGIVLTGRGLNKVGAHAPGANSTHIGVQIMVANPQDANEDQLRAFREFRQWLVGKGVTNRVSGHRDWVSTSCPGDHLYRRVKSGDWGTGGNTPESPSGSSGATWSIGEYEVPKGDPILLKGSSGSLVKALQRCLLAWRSSLLPVWKDDGSYGDECVEAVEAFQTAFGLFKDGRYGPVTAEKMREVITSIVGPEGVLGLSKVRKFNDSTYEQILPRGEWQELRLGEGLYSLAFEGETYSAHVGIAVEGLNKGDEFQIRFTEVKKNPESGGPQYIRASSLPIDSPVHDAGFLHATASWAGQLPSDRRLRVEVIHYSTSETVKVIRRTAHVLHSD